ncbi:MAG: DegV family protein [Clostridia bacterium]|nr:DegV family protein [Clostridia bacterium]
MAKFFVDAFADMFGAELEKNNLILAPSKLKIGKNIIDFKGWNKPPTQKELNDLKNNKYSIVHITEQEWYEFFAEYLKQGEDVVFFAISLRLFSDGGADLLAAFTKLEQDFPGRKAKLVNTKTVSCGTSNIAVLTQTLFNKEKDLEKAVKFATTLSGQFVTAFVVDDVNFLFSNPILKQSGSDLTGGLLGVKPIISIDREGNFKLLDKARGFKSGVNKLFSIVQGNGENVADFTFSIVFANAELEALDLKNKFLQYVSENEVKITPSSLNILSIVGPKFVGITFHSK